MKGAGHAYWLIWFILGFGVPEALGILTRFPTLSETWWWLRDHVLPGWASLLLSAALGAAFLWLVSVHWIFSALDRPGFDRVERLVVAAGALLGLVGAVLARRRRRDRV